MGVPLDITFPSAHHSPSTVNRNARELVMGTVRLSSAIGGCQSILPTKSSIFTSSSPLFFFSQHTSQPSPPYIFSLSANNFPHVLNQKRSPPTSLPNQQKEPHTPRQIHHQWHRVRRTPEQIDNRPYRLQYSPFHPPSFCTRVDALEGGVRRGVEVEGCAPDEGRCETPGETDEEEAEGPIED